MNATTHRTNTRILGMAALLGIALWDVALLLRIVGS